jgi:hypothetical protein
MNSLPGVQQPPNQNNQQKIPYYLILTVPEDMVVEASSGVDGSTQVTYTVTAQMM